MSLFSIFSKRKVHLEIHDHVIRYVDAKQPSLQSIKAAGEKHLPPGMIKGGKIADRDQLSIILDQCVDEWKIKRRPVQFLVPDGVVVVRQVEIERDIPDDEVKGHLYLKIGTDIHLPFEDPVIDWVPFTTNPEADGRKVLIFAAPEHVVADYAALFGEVKLTPVAADLSALALYRFWHALGRSRATEHVLCLQCNGQTVNASIFHGHQLIFSRHMTLDLDPRQWQVQTDELGHLRYAWTGDRGTLEEAWQNALAELERIMNFYRFTMNQGQGVTRFLIAGDSPYQGRLARDLESSFEWPVEILDNADCVTTTGEAVPPCFYTLLGLVLKEVN
ncbi:hypothetical protein CathTA2_2957 [Caldalkalibacillus thermarum TA2.A1]|uniref:Pilus assembly protein PilM n=1 Tax=Caldalkalibacillus thermarum (strain TA2.A1) TaxID=986075 RepID=F5LAM2_CALTT|nr:pilus assembly protein PilM [Caldalkalibacillus thermarum]EGL81594.1 hypothetical protein CathTA2_2957 [Caldalkalibacillus thermarum TA2.A1]QZT33517.1 pilus assembly protein PilM [Caldalkalibacillus thermarum TA2.A1]